MKPTVRRGEECNIITVAAVHPVDCSVHYEGSTCSVGCEGPSKTCWSLEKQAGSEIY
jgi:hypothetical protein